MISLSIALIVVAFLAYLTARSWLALQRQRHEDTKCRVLSAEQVQALSDRVETLTRSVNSVAIKVGLGAINR